jgi:hypothetical protein
MKMRSRAATASGIACLLILLAAAGVAASGLRAAVGSADSGPSAPTITGHPADVDTSTTATFTFVDAMPRVSYLCRLDRGRNLPCSSPKTYTGLALGVHLFGVQAADVHGNTSPASSFEWKIVVAVGLPFTIAGSPLPGVLLYPGGAPVPVNLVFTNPNSSPITIESTTMTVAGTSVGACGAGNFNVARQLAAKPIVPAGATASLQSLGVPQAKWPQLLMLDRGNQDSCRNATLNLSFAGTADGGSGPVPWCLPPPKEEACRWPPVGQ